MKIKSFENFKDFKDAITGLAPGDVTGVKKIMRCDGRWRIAVFTKKGKCFIFELGLLDSLLDKAFDETLRCIPASWKEILSLAEGLDELERARTIHVTDIGILRQQVRGLRWGLIATGVAVAVIAIMQIL